MKRIILAVAWLGLAGGGAAADRFHGGRGGGGHAELHGSAGFHGGGGYHGGGVVVRDHRYEGGVHVSPGYRYNGGYYNGGYHNYSYARRPIYMARPIIRERYYDYRYRPEVIVENYGARPGYYWVNGSWQWNGYEWIWQPGYYQPDPNWVDPNVSVGVGIGVGYCTSDLGCGDVRGSVDVPASFRELRRHAIARRGETDVRGGSEPRIVCRACRIGAASRGERVALEAQQPRLDDRSLRVRQRAAAARQHVGVALGGQRELRESHRGDRGVWMRAGRGFECRQRRGRVVHRVGGLGAGDVEGFAIVVVRRCVRRDVGEPRLAEPLHFSGVMPSIRSVDQCVIEHPAVVERGCR